MEFASERDMGVAVVMMVRHLPAFLRAFEEGLRALGLEILERSQHIDEAGSACPVIVARGARLRFRLELRAAFEDFLTLDREERPARVDPRLIEEPYAREKMARVVSGRLEVVQALEESTDLAEVRRRLRELAPGFEWLRVDIEGEARGEGAP